MMTPFRQTTNLTQEQKYYNKKVSSVRQSVERAIGHLKGRFRRLRDLNCIHVKESCYIIVAACIMHNLCVLSEDDIARYLQDGDEQNNAVVNNYPVLFQPSVPGVEKRNAIVNHLQNFA